MELSHEPPPGCLVLLTPLSEAAGGDARVWLAHRLTADGEPEVRDLPAAVAARFLADELLEVLANTLDGGYAVPLDVAVIGYHAGEDGAPKLVSLLPGEDRTPRLVPLAEVAGLPVEMRGREGDPRKWTAAVECSGTAPAAAALAEVYRLVSVWLTGRYAARPPVIIHCTTGEGLDSHYARVARSLGLLATAYGPARLLHVGFDAVTEPALCGMWPEGVGEPWAGLQELSAELPAEAEGRPARRAVSVNDWSVADAWGAIFELNPTEAAGFAGGAFDPAVQSLWTQKMGNAPQEWEDAYAADAAAGVAAVADGASTGIYCRVWADQLSKRFVAERPDLRDPDALNRWVAGLRGEWRAGIDYPKLHWAKQRKVDEAGAAATLLGLELGPAGDDGNHPFRAAAVGDACLFWVRGGELLASFPVVDSEHFGSAPLLVRSNPGFRTLAVAAAGTCRPGDRFLLATDAVASRLLKSVAHGPGPEWERFEALDADTWRAELDALRRANDMVNDDCTLVCLRVAGGSPGGVPEVCAADPASGGRQPPEGEPEVSGTGTHAGTEAAEMTPPEPTPDEAPALPAEPDTNGTPEAQRTTSRDGFSDPTDTTV